MWTAVHRGASLFYRYTSVLRAAHGRIKIRSIRGSDLHNCTWTGTHELFFVFRLFRVDWLKIILLSTPNRRAWVLRTDIPSGKFPGRFTTETLLSFAFCALYHQSGSTYKAINCCSTVCHVDGHLVSVLNSLLKRVLHVLRNTFGQLLRSFSAPLRNLSRSKRPNEVKTVCFTNPLHSILVSAD